MSLLATFARSFLSPTFYVTDLVFVASTVLMLGEFDWHVRTLLARLGDFALLLAFEFALVLAQYAATGSLSSTYALLAVVVLYAALQRGIRNADRLVRTLTLYSTFVLTTGITGIMSPALGKFRGIPFGSWIPNAFSGALMVAVALFVRRLSVSRFRYIPSNFAYLAALVDIVAAVTGLLFMNFMGDYQVAQMDVTTNRWIYMMAQRISGVNLVVDISLLVLMLVSYAMFYLLAREHESRTELLVRRRAESDNAEMIGVTKSVYESMREMRHEMRNTQAYMGALIDAGKYDELRRYFATYRSDSAALLRYVQTGNGAIDAVVNAKIALARSKGIELKTMLAVPERLPFAEDDLYTLIANLLDNAIEGTQDSGAEGDGRLIEFVVRPEGGYYILSTKNPCRPGRPREGSFARLRTTKRDTDVHGYGTRIIDKIARRYNGSTHFSARDGAFEATVMLAAQGEQASSGKGSAGGTAEGGGV